MSYTIQNPVKKAGRDPVISDTMQLLRTSTFIGPVYYAALLFLGLGFIVLLFVLLFSQPIREDLEMAVYCPNYNRDRIIKF